MVAQPGFCSPYWGIISGLRRSIWTRCRRPRAARTLQSSRGREVRKIQCRRRWTTDVRGCQSVESEVLGPCSTIIDQCRHTHPCPWKERDIGIIAAGRSIASEAADRATPVIIGATEEGVGCVVVVRFISTIRSLSFGRIFEGKRLTRRTLFKAAESAPC